MLNANVSLSSPIEDRWSRQRAEYSLVNPNNRRHFSIIVVGTGLAGAAAAASLDEQGYKVKAFTSLDSPRRAHSIAAQGGINAAKNYCNDGDSVLRLFNDTLRGGDFRSRESNVYRLAELSNAIIDLCVAQGVPFARDYAGYLDNRSFGGAQLARTFYAKGQTGQQLLLGAYGALMSRANEGTLEIYTRREMLDLVLVDGKARGIITRHTLTGEIEAHAADAVLLCTGGYANVFYLSTNAVHCNGTAAWACHKRGALFANPCFTQIHPTCIPQHGDHQSKLTLMSESLRNDARVWVPKTQSELAPQDVAEQDRDYFLERMYPHYGNLVPRDIASRAAKRICDEGRGVGPTKRAVYLDFKEAQERLGRQKIDEKYGNLFEMYERITAEDPHKTPMRIYPAAHYTMGGLWVDYQLMTNIDGLFCLGEANFSDHGANRLGASALMQGLADGYFIAPATVPNYLANAKLQKLDENHDAFGQAKDELHHELNSLCLRKGELTPSDIHKKLGYTMREHVGMSRSAESLKTALAEIEQLQNDFDQKIKVYGKPDMLNPELEKAVHLHDYLELARIITLDASAREESCGCHFREEYQTAEGETLRNDEKFAHVSCFKYGSDQSINEKLEFYELKPSQRNYR
ncbi:MAG: fumarate reductase/succinate dehydrogenase flavoprotein subunit [Bradymonadales bacterium]|jgi:succinate dehydrogenase / fumarate reductase flavoprotein subunit